MTLILAGRKAYLIAQQAIATYLWPNCGLTSLCKFCRPWRPAAKCGVILPAELIFLRRACVLAGTGSQAVSATRSCSARPSPRPLRAPIPSPPPRPPPRPPPYPQTLAASPASATPLPPILPSAAPPPPPAPPSPPRTLATAATLPRPPPPLSLLMDPATVPPASTPSSAASAPWLPT